ncbi:MAG: GTPase Era [Deltaproteobacteria bacterium]|nr:GTPase Era [Deltaproteobacteria bacterium]
MEGKTANQNLTEDYRAGFVAIVGAPNSGKSSLLNFLLGQKIAIVTAKPQTTRHRILGVVTEKIGQLVFFDTPGLHHSEKLLNRSMVAAAKSALADADVCLWLVDGCRRGPDHEAALEAVMARGEKPLVAALNKADLVSDEKMEELKAEIQSACSPKAAIVVSAKTGQGLKELPQLLIGQLPVSPPLYGEDELTDQTLRAIAAEYLREAVFCLTRQEVPYSVAVSIDSFCEPDPADRKPLYRIEATVHVERESQKKLLIGEGGRKIKSIGMKARQGLEEFLECQVFLSVFVRITRDWSEKEKLLEEFGYLDSKLSK